MRFGWTYDSAYGTGTGEFVGEIIEMDDWIKAIDDHDVILHVPLSCLKELEPA
jgi:hypothetical protein